MTGGRLAVGDTVGVADLEQRWTLIPVEWSDPRAELLRAAMDAELGGRYGERFGAYPPELAAKHARDFALDPATVVVTLIVIGDDGEPVGHAALRTLGPDLEVKRVFVAAPSRGTGVSGALMAALERIAADRGASRLILQTGDLQPEAVGLYERIGYERIPIFPPYVDYDFSLCFQKLL